VELAGAAGCLGIVRCGASIALLAVLSCLPARARAWASAENERVSREMTAYEQKWEAVRELLAAGAPAAVLSALRSHERSNEVRLRTLAKAMLYEGIGSAMPLRAHVRGRTAGEHDGDDHVLTVESERCRAGCGFGGQ
jgi:hypothetical protein